MLQNVEEFIAVAYDLAIAKVALKTQATESPKYGTRFANLGALHSVMASFSATGKYKADSGGPQLLNQSRIQEKESHKGFITGKSYDRCRKNHQYLLLLWRHFTLENLTVDLTMKA